MNLASRTVGGWRTYILRAHNFFKGKPASVVTRQDIRPFAEAPQQGDKRASPKGRALAAKSINDNCLTALSNVYSLPMKEGILSSDLTKGAGSRNTPKY
ncbi:hypothetical protein MELB17_19054 [Marinobacter sp. ELB17]|nr:hypothetical protein MELB17_19054 [Marinobacter sp. ELB17]